MICTAAEARVLRLSDIVQRHPLESGLYTETVLIITFSRGRAGRFLFLKRTINSGGCRVRQPPVCFHDYVHYSSQSYFYSANTNRVFHSGQAR